MCLLMVKPANVPIPENMHDICNNAYKRNQDGSGFATPRVYWRNHKASPYEFHKAILRDVTTAEPAIIHWRYGTGGGVTRGNCHPFRLNDGTIFAHNGIISHDYPPTATSCDTKVLANSVQGYFDLRARLNYLVDRNNKFAILQPGSNQVEIIGEEFGFWDNGCWFSNHGGTKQVDAADAIFDTVKRINLGPDQWCQLETELEPIINMYGIDAVEAILSIYKMCQS